MTENFETPKRIGEEMESAYKIEVALTPSFSENKTQPYYWVLYVHHGEWTTSTAGWAASPVLAFEEAYAFYVRYKA